MDSLPVVFSEALLAFLAGEDHLVLLLELVVGVLCVAFGAVEPLLAARSANGDLGVENVFAHLLSLFDDCVVGSSLLCRMKN